MPGFITDAVLNNAVCDEIQKARGTLTVFWPGIITQANVWAYNEIAARLVARGFTLAQVTAWDRGAEFQTDLGVWKAISDNAAMAPNTYNFAALAAKDRRDELSGNQAKKIEACIVTASYVFQVPTNTVGNVNTGPMQGAGIPSPLCWQDNIPPWDVP